MAKYITECKLNYHQSKKAGKIAIVTMDNGQLFNVPNTWGAEALESLNKVIDIVEKDADVKGWIMTGKPYIFNVGADIMSVDANAKRADALEIGTLGHKIFKRIMGLKFPTLAAINGAAMGGGVEVGPVLHPHHLRGGEAGRRPVAGPGGAVVVDHHDFEERLRHEPWQGVL